MPTPGSSPPHGADPVEDDAGCPPEADSGPITTVVGAPPRPPRQRIERSDRPGWDWLIQADGTREYIRAYDGRGVTPEESERQAQDFERRFGPVSQVPWERSVFACGPTLGEGRQHAMPLRRRSVPRARTRGRYRAPGRSSRQTRAGPSGDDPHEPSGDDDPPRDSHRLLPDVEHYVARLGRWGAEREFVINEVAYLGHTREAVGAALALLVSEGRARSRADPNGGDVVWGAQP